jgi:Pyridoxamine 5'-phosphate oxidase
MSSPLRWTAATTRDCGSALELSVGALIRCQPMRILDSVRAVLDGPGLAHLVTIEPDGRPQASIVWVGLNGDEIVAGHLPEHRKIRNMIGTRGSLCPSKRAPETSSGSTSTWSFMDAPGLRRAARRSCSSGWLTSTWDRRSSFLQWMTRRRVTSGTSP